MGRMILSTLKQWLVTERAKSQWKNYKAMVDDAKAKIESSAGLSFSPQETAPVSGISSSLDSGQIIPFY